jgi:hypothetical protein
MSRKGYDLFLTDPGSVKEMYCHVCHNQCKVTRNVYGPTSFVAAMAKKYRYHDVFECPHRDEEWHEQALRIVLAIEESPSKRIAELMKLDLEDLLREHNHL